MGRVKENHFFPINCSTQGGIEYRHLFSEYEKEKLAEG